jgi:hypothetical protein
MKTARLYSMRKLKQNIWFFNEDLSKEDRKRAVKLLVVQTVLGSLLAIIALLLMYHFIL